MKRKILLFVMLLTVVTTGCSTATSTDSAELESLKTQVEALKKENDTLKEQIANSDKSESPQETEKELEETISNEGSGKDVINIGETGNLKEWSLVVTEVKLTDSVSDNQFTSFTPDDGNQYLVVETTITNNGKSAASFLPSYGFGDDIGAKIIYQNEYEFSSVNLLGYGGELHDSTVNPLSSKKGFITFEIPESVASAEEELILQVYSGNKKVSFKVR